MISKSMELHFKVLIIIRRLCSRDHLQIVTEYAFNLSVDEYVAIAKEKHGYNVEQALGMLFWHKHNIEKALSDLPNFTPFPDEWTVEDKVLFEQAYSFHGKSFHRIKQMVKFLESWC